MEVEKATMEVEKAKIATMEVEKATTTSSNGEDVYVQWSLLLVVTDRGKKQKELPKFGNGKTKTFIRLIFTFIEN